MKQLWGHFFLMLGFCSIVWAQESVQQPLIIPRPRLERWSGRSGTLVRPGEPVRVGIASLRAGPETEGMSLLSRRLSQLGFGVSSDASGSPHIVAARCTQETMVNQLRTRGIDEELDSVRLNQAYILSVPQEKAGGREVRIEATSGLGLYYALISLCQLLDTDRDGNLVLPIGQIVDYPEIGIRLAKTSASMSAPEDIERFAAWLPANKISHIGLQYHGKNSKDPEPHFPENVSRFCHEFRRKGTLESIVYFCPFRGEVTGGKGAYDFTKQEDREDYVEYIRWIMEQGAHGIEVDYNDWPGSPEVPIADVLNLACETVTKADPDALVLYCPPARGEESYRGMATAQLGRTLSQVPERVWPLWTGMQTLITEPLSEERVLEWTRIAGRRPFLWVNRVGPAVKVPFVQKVEGEPGGLVFAGDFLPNDLNRLFEGVHLNAGLQSGYNKITGEFDEEALVYLATTADYLWSPRGWKPEESLHRGRRFVDVMTPLVRKD